MASDLRVLQEALLQKDLLLADREAEIVSKDVELMQKDTEIARLRAQIEHQRESHHSMRRYVAEAEESSRNYIAVMDGWYKSGGGCSAWFVYAYRLIDCVPYIYAQ